MIYRCLHKFHEIHPVSYRNGQLEEKKKNMATFQYLGNIVRRCYLYLFGGAALIHSSYADVLVGVCGVRGGSSGSVCARVGSNTGSSTTLMLLLCMMSCSMLKISSARNT